MNHKVMLTALIVLCAGCGYKAGFTVRNDVRTLAVPVFSNDTFYRGIEIDLTREIVTALEKKTPYRLADRASADAVLEGKISEYRAAVLQEDAGNNPTETEIVLAVKVTVRRVSDDKVLFGDVFREGESFSIPLGETEAQARRTLFRRAAIRIVEIALEQEW